MANEVQIIKEQNEVTQKLLMDYLTTITDKLDETQRLQFCAVAQAFNLNPFKREIYATTYKDKQTGKTNMSIVVGYEVYLKRAEMNPNFDGFETEFNTDKDRGISCTCTVYRKDRNHPTKSTVFMKEYSTGRSLWLSKPTVMLEKVAICTAFRRSFPSDFGGIPYAPEELAQTTEDQLKEKGFTEVKQEEAPAPKAIKQELTEQQKRDNFVKMMGELAGQNPDNYATCMKFLGYETEEEVLPEDRAKVYKLVKEVIEKSVNEPETIEATEVQNG